MKDNGLGIPRTQRDRIFDPELDRKHRFGLYLVKSLITQMMAESGSQRTIQKGRLSQSLFRGRIEGTIYFLTGFGSPPLPSNEVPLLTEGPR